MESDILPSKGAQKIFKNRLISLFHEKMKRKSILGVLVVFLYFDSLTDVFH